MNWLGFQRKESKEIDIPLFPLGGVLFPGGVLSLKVFEQRYLDMTAACMKDKAPFGVCLIASGKEVGESAVPHKVGTLAHIDQADMPQLGILMLTVRGGRRFRIVSTRTRPDGLLRAQVELLAEPARQDVPAAQQGLLPLLHKVAGDLGPEKMPAPHAFDDAAWVGYRLTEIVPVQALAKQKLLELDDPLSRLQILHTYLAQRKLVL
ncbi:MAG: LON peptidase substrate-binding domain-containing protein [Propionivibrio sp.]|uniref:LON peptidase substrate-binding domain-containing protein n=1 Tax=Propionivibrio sp. TaxID=2212460 RepID=UPI001A5874F1|nr:LON peptidase substrate-binding domain-containing protein [Propionivibrio sp.]MBL8415366.1 LON peptidase substrate-binding domain-containing protein [Propionivibrio sp.]